VVRFMNSDKASSPSRREFIQLAAAGAGVLATLKPNAKPASGRAECPLQAERAASTATLTVTVKTGSSVDQEHTEASHQTVDLSGMWSVLVMPLETLGESGYATFVTQSNGHISAQVPGEIHLDLMRAGQMEDPSVSDNARTRCRWPEEKSWWYRTEFPLPEGFQTHVQQLLIFDGIDLYGQIFVNGKFAATTQDAFAAVEVDVTGIVKEGRNELVVRVTSGTELAREKVASPFRYDLTEKADPSRAFAGRRFLRKSPYMYGWDFCDALPSIGIWRGVRLEGRSKIVIDSVRLETWIKDDNVSLEGDVVLRNLHPWNEVSCILELRLRPPKGEEIVQRLAGTVPSGPASIGCTIAIEDPQLWWPNGMGEQPLYELNVSVVCDKTETDRRTQTLGLRTIELDRSPLSDGSRFGVRVNGQLVFCKGANWAPADLIPARVDAARYRELVLAARDAHFTMFRVNGVGLYESDEFYDACDRAGILIWQDFIFSDDYTNQTPEFLARVRDEASKQIKRLRHHPSLALWCGSNECMWWWTGEISGPPYDPTKPGQIPGLRIFNEVLPEVCRDQDNSRPYWPSSPYGGSTPNSEFSGDCHWWFAAGMSSDMGRRARHEVYDECRARFISEYGIVGPAHIASVREYLKPDEQSRKSLAWRIHTNSFDRGPSLTDPESATNTTTLAGIKHHYGDPTNLSLEEFILYGQMVQAVVHGGALEAIRFRKDDQHRECRGALIWSFNDTWGETGWSIIDYYLRRKPSYYWFRRAAAPVKVLVRSREGALVTRVVNDTLRSYPATVQCGWMRLDGQAREMRSHAVTVPANGMVEIDRDSIPSERERSPRDWLYAAVLQGRGVAGDQAIWLLGPHRSLALSKPKISASVHSGMLEVISPVYCHGVHIDGEQQEGLVDNYIELLPGIARRIPLDMPDSAGAYRLHATMPIGL
jgi:beta-mannosidase